MSDAPVLVAREGAVARLTLNRPEAGNTLDQSMAKALMAAAIGCDEDAGVRCVVLQSSGKLFCGGGDVNAFAAAGDAVGAYIKETTAYLHQALSRLLRMQKPLVTAVQGPAAGAGLSLAIIGDIALAARSAHFTSAYTALGVSPDGSSTWVLPRLIGMRRAQEMMLLNRRLTAEEAAAIGLITRVVDDAALADETASVADTLAHGATRAIGQTRNLLLASFGTGLEEQMEAESRGIAAAAAGPEGREGVAAFLAKRKPSFTS